MPQTKKKNIRQMTYIWMQEMAMKGTKKNNKFMGSVKVGPKGQIVIPKEVREMFGIETGETLIILADKNQGIAIEKYSIFSKIADTIFAGKSKEIYPDQTEEDALEFAKGIKSIDENDKKGKCI